MADHKLSVYVKVCTVCHCAAIKVSAIILKSNNVLTAPYSLQKMPIIILYILGGY